MLSRLGAITIEAENGKIALDILHGKTPNGTHHLPDRFDLCFLDNQMPVMSGIACIKALRASDAPCSSQLVCAVT
jgi:CheY-like chemotaxis protein